MTQMVGLFLGIGTSFFSWWVLFHGIRPRIAFSPQIRKHQKKLRGRNLYTFKVQNTGSRDMIDVTCYAALRYKSKRGLWRSVFIPMSPQGDRSTSIPRILRRAYYCFDLHIEQMKGLETEPEVPAAMVRAAKLNKLKLEDLLTLQEANISIKLLGYDAFSGSRKLFEHLYISPSSVEQGAYQGMDITDS